MITYSATLDVPTDSATLLTDLLIAERRRRGTGIGGPRVGQDPLEAQPQLLLTAGGQDRPVEVGGDGAVASAFPAAVLSA